MTDSGFFMRKKILVISGGPGFGKSSLINELVNWGFIAGSEAAREIIAEQLQSNGSILPWRDIGAFQNAVLMRRISFWQSVAEDQIAFTDRAIPDQLAFARFRGFSPSALLIEAASKYQYFEEVLICPPWEEIYTCDEIRKESFSEACRLHDLICKEYQKLGYRLIELPKVAVNDRVKFIKDLFDLLL